MWEGLLIMIILLLALQQTSLYASILLIPTTTIVVISSSFLNQMDKLYGLLLMMMFVGGLLVLLVSVASLSSQEEGTLSNFSVIILMSYLMVMIGPSMKMESTVHSFIYWYWQLKVLAFVLLVILAGLTTVSKFLTEIKGMVRSS